MINFERKEHYGLSDLLRIVALLRSEDGCPWDRVQTHASLRRSLLEEAYEAAEAIDRAAGKALLSAVSDSALRTVPRDTWYSSARRVSDMSRSPGLSVPFLICSASSCRRCSVRV